MTDLPNKTLLRPDEVAVFFSKSKKTIYRWIELGDIEAIKTKSGSRMILRESVMRLLAQRED
jgi:excisionase family DNA binding protein